MLAATLSPSYGIYSGFENFENVPAHEGSEEYLHSEKYEIKKRALDGPLLPMVGRMNGIRRDNAALQQFSNVTFLETANEALIAYAKHVPGNTVITVVNLDPPPAAGGLAIVPARLGVAPSVHRPRPAHRRALRVADRTELRAAGARFPPGARPHNRSLNTSPDDRTAPHSPT